jgi:hypothetical protein
VLLSYQLSQSTTHAEQLYDSNEAHKQAKNEAAVTFHQLKFPQAAAKADQASWGYCKLLDCAVPQEHCGIYGA